MVATAYAMASVQLKTYECPGLLPKVGPPEKRLGELGELVDVLIEVTLAEAEDIAPGETSWLVELLPLDPS